MSSESASTLSVPPPDLARPALAQASGTPRRALRVAFCWTQVSGYMASCWRTLAQTPGFDLYVGLMGLTSAANVGFKERGLLQGIPHDVFDQATHASMISRRVIEFKPDIVVLCGWAYPQFREMPLLPELRDTKFVMTMDTPWTGKPRQLMGRFAYRKFFERISRVIVAAERTWQLARWLGFQERQLMRGMYSIDGEHFEPIAQRRQARGAWPRQFLFMGRYVPDKAIDVLVEGHARYALMTDNPWPLVCRGQGPLADLLRARPGVVDAGFVQPEDAPKAFEDAGCFVLPSRYEPWGAVLAEAAASGLPLICSESCGAGVDLVQHMFNGYRVATNDSTHLADAMAWIHAHESGLPEMGAHSQQLAKPYHAKAWAQRWSRMFEEVMVQNVPT